MKSKKPKSLKNSVKSFRDTLGSIKSDKKKKNGNGNKLTNQSYPNFTYMANELSAFTLSFDTFTILLKEGGVINYTADNTDQFRKWLIENKVRDITDKFH